MTRREAVGSAARNARNFLPGAWVKARRGKTLFPFEIDGLPVRGGVGGPHVNHLLKTHRPFRTRRARPVVEGMPYGRPLVIFCRALRFCLFDAL